MPFFSFCRRFLNLESKNLKLIRKYTFMDDDIIEAERLVGIAEKLLQARDFSASRDFAILAQETAPLLDGTDQILAISDVLLAANKRINNQHDWYSILKLHRRSDDLCIVRDHYRRLAILLHPDKNKFPFSDEAFKLVSNALTILSNPTRKKSYDHELDSADLSRSKFWTACPYCYSLYEYPSGYEECCLRCQNCSRAFQAVVVPSLPPLVPGKDSYYCCLGVFPMGFAPGAKN